MTRKLTESEIENIQYFHEYHGDLTRWVGWDELLPLLQEHHPELVKAVNDVRAANKILDLVVEALDEQLVQRSDAVN